MFLNDCYPRPTRGYSSPQRLNLRQGTGWGALGFAAGDEEGFIGQHAGELLVIVDEASGNRHARKLGAADRPRSDTVFNLGYDEEVAKTYPFVARLTPGWPHTANPVHRKRQMADQARAG